MLNKRLISVFTILFFSLGCSMLEKNQNQGDFKLRSYQRETLSNGLEVVWLQDESLPRLSLQLLIKAGSVYETNEESGLNALVASMLAESSEKRSTMEIAQEREFFGIDFSSRGSLDYTTLSINGLSLYNKKIVEFFAESLFSPAFNEADLKRRKANIIAGLMRIYDDPSQVADVAFSRALLGDDPYGRLISGNPKTVQDFTREDLLRFYKLYYRPERSILAVSGKFDSTTKNQIKEVFQTWKKWENVENHKTYPQLSPAQVLFYSKKGLEQTQIRFGHLSIARNHPDYLALRAANMVFGGAFASRLNQVIRDDKGLTYSVHSGQDTNLRGGSFEISTFTRHEKVSEMIESVKSLFQKFVAEGITEAELEGAKSVIIGQFPMAVETTDRLGFNLLALWAMGVPESYLTRFQSQVRSITLEQVNEAIKTHYHPDKLQILVYTDQEKISRELIKKMGVTKFLDFKL